MMQRTLRIADRRIALPLLLAVALLVVAAAGALAWFSASGSGTGSGANGTVQPVTVQALVGGDAPASKLQPGGSADVILRLSNPNSFALTLTAVSGGSPISADSGHGGCTTTGVSFANQSGLSISVPSGSSLVHLSGAASMDATSSSGCQGATFSIPVSLSVRK
jgi:hypothetical protein